MFFGISYSPSESGCQTTELGEPLNAKLLSIFQHRSALGATWLSETSLPDPSLPSRWLPSPPLHPVPVPALRLPGSEAIQSTNSPHQGAPPTYQTN